MSERHREQTPLLKAKVQGVRVLALVAHPDDEAWALAPTLNQLVRSGAELAVVSATAGEAGADRSGSGLMGAELGEARLQEFAGSVRQMGGEALPSPRFPDGGLSAVIEGQWGEWFDRLLERQRPDVWMTLAEDGGYGHRDHVALTRALLRWSARTTARVRLWCAPSAMAAAMSAPLRRYAPDVLDAEAPEPGSCWLQADEVLWVDDAREVMETCLAHHGTQLRQGRPSSFFGDSFWRSVEREQRWRVPAHEEGGA